MEIASDGASVFTSVAFQTFLSTWGVKHRMSSAYYPQSNKRAEVAVKSAKRLVQGNLGEKGELDTDNFARAILEHRNTPNDETSLSPAMVVMGKELKGFLPNRPQKYEPRAEWRLEADQRAKAFAKRHLKQQEELSHNARQLPPLKLQDTVAIQDQHSSKPGKWTQTGTIVEVLPYDAYRVRVDGSRTISQRNRKHLRVITPFKPSIPEEEPVPVPPVSTPVTQATPEPTYRPRVVPELPQGTQTTRTGPPVALPVTTPPPPAAPPSPPQATTASTGRAAGSCRCKVKEKWIVRPLAQGQPDPLPKDFGGGEHPQVYDEGDAEEGGEDTDEEEHANL